MRLKQRHHHRRPRLRYTGIAAMLIAFAILTGCHSGSRKDSQRINRNLILISIDSLRADHVGCYGYGKSTTPFLDEFSRQGVRFNNSYSSSSWTLPSHASLFTGLTPTTHGVVKFKSSLKPWKNTLPGIAQEKGLKTIAVVCAPLLKKRYGLHQGFDVYDTDLIPPEYEEALISKVAARVTDKALGYVDKNRDNPFFLFLHYWDVHYDYNPPEKYANMFDPEYDGKIDGLNIRYRKDMTSDMDKRDLQHIVSLYDGEIRYTDDEIGRLITGLDQRGLSSKTMVVITSDHGEEFLEHGWKGHTNTCYEEVIKVPLLMKIPWVKTLAPVVDDYVSTIDLFPTILSALGIKHEELALQGMNVIDTFSKNKKLERSFITAETRYGQIAPPLTSVGPWKALILPDRQKFHYYGKKSKGYSSLLFDLKNDPHELNNLSEKKEDLTNRYREALKHELTIQKKLKKKLDLSKNKTLDTQTGELLKGLGYIQ